MGVIRGIADQTNLLALNAAIEDGTGRLSRARGCGGGGRGALPGQSRPAKAPRINRCSSGCRAGQAGGGGDAGERGPRSQETVQGRRAIANSSTAWWRPSRYHQRHEYPDSDRRRGAARGGLRRDQQKEPGGHPSGSSSELTRGGRSPTPPPAPGPARVTNCVNSSPASVTGHILPSGRDIQTLPANLGIGTECGKIAPFVPAFVSPSLWNEIVKAVSVLIRQLSYGLVYASLEEHKELSRTDLSRLTGLSPPASPDHPASCSMAVWWLPVARARWAVAAVGPCCASASAASSFSPCALAAAVDVALFDLAGRSSGAPSPRLQRGGPPAGEPGAGHRGFLPRRRCALPASPSACRGRWSATPAWSSTSPTTICATGLGPTLQEAFSVPVLVSGDVRTWIQAERGGAARTVPMRCWCSCTTTSGSAWWSAASSSSRQPCSGISATCSSALRPALLLRRFGCACTLVTNQALEGPVPGPAQADAGARSARGRHHPARLCELALAGSSLCQDILHQAAGRLPALANLICLLNPGKLLLGRSPGPIACCSPCCTSPWRASCRPTTWVRLQIESTHFYEDPTKPTSVQVHKALRDGSLLLELLLERQRRPDCLPQCRTILHWPF